MKKNVFFDFFYKMMKILDEKIFTFEHGSDKIKYITECKLPHSILFKNKKGIVLNLVLQQKRKYNNICYCYFY